MSTPTFVAEGPFVPGQPVTLGEDDVHHMRVRRVDVGAEVALVDGRGGRAAGVVVRVLKRNATVDVRTASVEPAGRGIHLLLPVADKERMLLLAEKAAELGASSWRPVMYRRSRSVMARGEGPMFTRKVLARMTSALEQSGVAWLPVIYPDATVERAIAAAPAGVRVVLDAAGGSLTTVFGAGADAAGGNGAGEGDAGAATDRLPVVIAVGPEGGLEPDELDLFTRAGFASAAIGSSVLRFETAAIAALGVVQSLVHIRRPAPASPDHAQGE